jgi:hypothetical protein
MSVDADISRRTIQEELEAMAPLIASYRWEVTTDLPGLTVAIKLQSTIDSEVYILEATCDDYKELPPFFEFIHPETRERGTKRCYPADGSFFWVQADKPPRICVQWNRKAYGVHGGPHSDWPMSNWMTLRPGMVVLGDFFHLVQRQINNKQAYTGRMEH